MIHPSFCKYCRTELTEKQRVYPGIAKNKATPRPYCPKCRKFRDIDDIYTRAMMAHIPLIFQTIS